MYILYGFIIDYKVILDCIVVPCTVQFYSLYDGTIDLMAILLTVWFYRRLYGSDVYLQALAGGQGGRSHGGREAAAAAGAGGPDQRRREAMSEWSWHGRASDAPSAAPQPHQGLQVDYLFWYSVTLTLTWSE